MEQIITPCGDNCSVCPRYTSKTDKELQKVAELWYRVGWRDKIISLNEIICTGCSSHKTCTYGLIECIYRHDVSECNQCPELPCLRINDMLQKTKQYEKRCRDVCTESEFEILRQAFFEKEVNLKK